MKDPLSGLNTSVNKSRKLHSALKLLPVSADTAAHKLKKHVPRTCGKVYRRQTADH